MAINFTSSIIDHHTSEQFENENIMADFTRIQRIDTSVPFDHPNILRAFLYGYIRADNALIPLISKSKFPNTHIDNVERSSSSGYISSSGPITPNDTNVLSEINLPEFIELKENSLGSFYHISVLSRNSLSRGTVIGIFTGERVQPTDILNTSSLPYIWEVIYKGKIIYALDGSKDSLNWMKYISHARNTLEQNIDVVYIEENDQLIFQLNRDIETGIELLAWYPCNDWLTMILEPCIAQPLASIENHPKIRNPDVNSINTSGNKEECGETGEFVCHKCGSVFNYQYYLDRHRKYTSCIDSGDRNFVCKICKRTFQKAERLRVHVKQVHEKIKPYKCTICKKDFSQSSSLTKHLRIHTGDRPYKCSECGKEFTASSILTTHMRQHTGEKPFKCKLCKRGFASHAAHHSHARRSHGIEPKVMRNMILDENDSPSRRKNT